MKPKLKTHEGRHPDVILIQKHLKSPNSDAFEEIVKKYYAQVYTFSHIQSKDATQADDIAQTVFMILHQRIHNIQGEHLAGWLMKTTKFVALNARRFESRYQSKLVDYQENKISNLTEEKDPLCDDILEGLTHLKDRQKQLICLRFFEGLSFKEIALRLNLSENAAQLATAKAKDKLYQWLTQRHKSLSSLSLAIPFQKIKISIQNHSMDCLNQIHANPSLFHPFAKTFASLAFFEKVKIASALILCTSLIGSVPYSLHGNKETSDNTPVQKESMPLV